MKALIAFALLFSLVAPKRETKQEPMPVNLIQLIATPERFDGKLVSVTGYLVMEERCFLSVYREDAENLLGNGVSVISSAEMIKHKEKLNGMYVVIAGVFRAIPTESGGTERVIEDVRACTVWSDPARPRSREQYGKGPPPPTEK